MKWERAFLSNEKRIRYVRCEIPLHSRPGGLVVPDSIPVVDMGWEPFIAFLWGSVLNSTLCVSGKHTNFASEQRQ